MATPRPLPLALTPEERPLLCRRRMDAAEDFLHMHGKQLVTAVGGQNHESTAWPQDMKCLLHHVDLQLPFALLRAREQHGLKISREVPKIPSRHNLRRNLALGQFSAQTPRLKEIELVAGSGGLIQLRQQRGDLAR